LPVAHICKTSSLGGWDQENQGLRLARADSLWKRLHLQNNQSKMDWRCGSNDKVPALQTQSQVQTTVPQKKKVSQNST
jgi:hypothetical protein